MIGEASTLQARIEVRAPGTVRAADARAGFRSGAPRRRAQDAQAQEFSARMRAPIFDLRATNRHAARNPQPPEIALAPGSAGVQGVVEASAGTIAVAAGLQLPNSGDSDRLNPLRRLSVNDAYLSAETLDGPFAHRGSIFDLQI